MFYLLIATSIYTRKQKMLLLNISKHFLIVTYLSLDKSFIPTVAKKNYQKNGNHLLIQQRSKLEEQKIDIYQQQKPYKKFLFVPQKTNLIFFVLLKNAKIIMDPIKRILTKKYGEIAQYKSKLMTLLNCLLFLDHSNMFLFGVLIDSWVQECRLNCIQKVLLKKVILLDTFYPFLNSLGQKVIPQNFSTLPLTDAMCWPKFFW